MFKVSDINYVYDTYGIILCINHIKLTLPYFNKNIYESVDPEVRETFWSEVFDSIYYIKYDADFYDTPITSLSKLKSIGRSLSLTNSKITDLGDLLEVGKSMYVYNCPLKHKFKLQSVGETLFTNTFSIIDEINTHNILHPDYYIKTSRECNT